MTTAPLERHNTDILIVGAGGAGLFAALHACRAAPELSVTIAVKGLLGKCGCTRMVQGGYNVALGTGDSVERHFMDTIAGGKWLPHQEMAWKLCETAVIRVRELENEIGCFFDRNADGTLHQKAFAGQSFDRTVHKGDLTGIEIVNRLMEQVLARPVERLEEHRAVALIPDRSGEAIAGVLFVDMRSGVFRFVRAKAVLLATGGGPTMYRYHTPSGDKSMDGLAMALRCGLPLRDMEMVQFHPTGLLAGAEARMTGTVLEEGLRGAGGHLLDGNGRRFMFDHDDNGERATRDIVSRAIFDVMRTGSTTPHGGVYLSMSHLGPDTVRDQFKGMVRRCATAASTSRPGGSRSCRRRIISWAAWCAIPRRARRYSASMSPGRMPAAPTAPTGWAATGSPIPRYSAALPATRWPQTWRARVRRCVTQTKTGWRRKSAAHCIRSAGRPAMSTPCAAGSWT